MQRALLSSCQRGLLLSAAPRTQRLLPRLPVASPSLHRSFATIARVDGLPTISVQDAQREIKEFDYVVDCREDDEVAHGVIEGAYHIPLGQIIRDVDKPAVQKLKGKQVLIYCKAGRRSAMAAQLLNEKGFSATNLAGGYTEWLKAPDTNTTDKKH